jgi:hypothetical protein
MKQAGVWSFRTTTGVARVVNGSLRRRGTLRGFIVGIRQRFRSGSMLRHIGLAVGSVGAVGPIRAVVESVLAEGLIAGAVSAGLAAMLIMFGTAVMWTSLTWSLFGRSETVDIYDIVDVTVDPEECELTIQHTDDTGDRETTTVEVYDADELGDAVEILQLKGAPLNEATAELYDRG